MIVSGTKLMHMNSCLSVRINRDLRRRHRLVSTNHPWVFRRCLQQPMRNSIFSFFFFIWNHLELEQFLIETNVSWSTISDNLVIDLKPSSIISWCEIAILNHLLQFFLQQKLFQKLSRCNIIFQIFCFL